MNRDALFEGRAFDAFLFDLDGTLLSSVAAAERVWRHWAERHGLDVQSFLPTIHGVRSIDTLRRLALPGIDVAREAQVITQAEIGDTQGVSPIAGAGSFLDSLPRDRWAIVTSAPRALAEARLRAAGLRPAPLLITAEDVQAGKPDPQGYVLAATRLGHAARDCLIFEDAQAGIEAAQRAGAAVMIITATHAHESVAGGTPATQATSVDYGTLAVGVRGDGALTLLERSRVAS